MSDIQEQPGAAATQAGSSGGQAGPSEDDRSEIGQRAAYEAELNRITSSEMILQTAISLLNIGGRRLGLAPAASPGGTPAATGERDLEQVRDAIDGASALLPILERRMPRELGPLRDAIAQLQVAYAREAQSAGAGTQAASQPSRQPKPPEKDSPAGSAGEEDAQQKGPGPAQASGRLWVPGR